MNKKIIYVGGKYGGEESNKNLIEDAIIRLKTNRGISLINLFNPETQSSQSLYYNNENTVYFSPVHAFGFQYNETDYMEGLDYCLSMLERCNELILLSNWRESFGATVEYGFAKGKGIPIKELRIGEGK